MATFQSAALLGASGWAIIAVLLVLAWLTISFLRRRATDGSPRVGDGVHASSAGPSSESRTTLPSAARTIGPPSGTVPPSTAASASKLTFAELTTTDGLRQAIAGLEWQEPTPLQQRVIPLVRERRDLLVMAPTGSGRTGAYLIPALDRQVDRDGLRTLVLVPTRTAVERVGVEAHALATPARLWVGELHAGEPAQTQVRDLQAGFDLLIATPSRLLEHVEAGNVRLDEVEVVILDQAKRLLAPSDKARVESIVSKCPAGKQTLVFAAEASEELDDFVRGFLRTPARVEAPAVAERSRSDRAGSARPAKQSSGGPQGDADRATGTVKWFSDTKGFGFIRLEEGDKDCFVHYSAIVGDGYRSLTEGDRVAFEIVPTSKGPEAANVVKV